MARSLIILLFVLTVAVLLATFQTALADTDFEDLLMKDVQAALNKGEAEMKDVMKNFEDSLKKELGAAFGVPVEASEDIPSCQAFFKSVMKSDLDAIKNDADGVKECINQLLGDEYGPGGGETVVGTAVGSAIMQVAMASMPGMPGMPAGKNIDETLKSTKAMIVFLVEKGFDKNTKNKKGKTWAEELSDNKKELTKECPDKILLKKLLSWVDEIDAIIMGKSAEKVWYKDPAIIVNLALAVYLYNLLTTKGRSAHPEALENPLYIFAAAAAIYLYFGYDGESFKFTECYTDPKVLILVALAYLAFYFETQSTGAAAPQPKASSSSPAPTLRPSSSFSPAVKSPAAAAFAATAAAVETTGRVSAPKRAGASPSKKRAGASPSKKRTGPAAN